MEEDDMDFTPTHSTGSKLASLFGINKTASAENSSLIYTPPKQPRKEASPSRTPPNEANKSNKLDIILAKGVQAYKLENGSYIGQGTVGITIIGSYASRIYQIIIYKGNKQHISKTRISRSFTFTVADNNYASFYDDAREIWSVMFNSSTDIQQFARQIAVSKLNSQTEPLSDVLIQDLTSISSRKVQLHNSVDVNYTYSIITSDEIGQPKEKSSKNYQLTENNNLPWLKGLIGCSEKCKRAIILPYSLSVPWTSQIPPNSNIILEIEIENINAEGVSPGSKTNAVETKIESPIDSSAEESTIKARGVSIKEALSTTKNHKANLISRMARMGQATLPLKGAIPCGPSDSEEESSISSSPKPARISRVRTPATLPTVQPSHVQDPGPINQSVAVYQNDLTWQQQQMMRSGVPLPYQQLIPVSTTPLTSPTSDTALSVYMSESRAQATELRMGITKVSDKVDQVLNKLQNLNASSQELTKTSQPPPMDPTGILTSIQVLVSENETLKSKVEEQKGKIEQQNDRIYHLLELNHKYLEQNSASQNEKEQARIQIETNNHKKVKNLEDELSSVRETSKNLQEEIMTVRESNKNLQAEIDQLKSNDVAEKESRIIKLESELLESTSSNRELEQKLLKTNEILESNKSELDKKVETLKNEAQLLRNENQELQTALENQKINIVDNDKERKEIEDLKVRIKRLSDEKQMLTSKLQEKSEIQGGNDSFVDDLKRVMNGTYANLKAEFEDDKEYLGSKIKKTIGLTIRDVTLEYLEMKQQSKPEMPKPIAKETKEEAIIQQETKTVEAKPIEEKEISKPTETLKKEIVENEKPKVKDAALEIKPTEENIVNDQDKFTEETNPREDTSPKEPKIKSENDGDKSYDQFWRTNKPPPVPLFEDDDDEDDWLK